MPCVYIRQQSASGLTEYGVVIVQVHTQWSPYTIKDTLGLGPCSHSYEEQGDQFVEVSIALYI